MTAVVAPRLPRHCIARATCRQLRPWPAPPHERPHVTMKERMLGSTLLRALKLMLNTTPNISVLSCVIPPSTSRSCSCCTNKDSEAAQFVGGVGKSIGVSMCTKRGLFCRPKSTAATRTTGQSRARTGDNSTLGMEGKQRGDDSRSTATDVGYISEYNREKDS